MITNLKIGGRYVEDSAGIYREFICSGPADVANLPTGNGSSALDRPRPGSTAVVPDGNGSSAIYMLSNDRTWVRLISEG